MCPILESAPARPRSRAACGCCVGLDIGAGAIKVAVVTRSERSDQVGAAAVVATPAGAVSDGIVSDPQAVGQAIRGALRDTAPPGTGTHAVISGSKTLLRWIDVPPLPHDELRQSARVQAERYLSYPVEEAVVDIVPTAPAEGSGASKALLVAAPARAVASHAEAADAAGLDPLSVDLHAFAVVRALTSGPPRPNGLWRTHPMGYLSIGATASDFYIARNWQLQFARSIAWGGATNSPGPSPRPSACPSPKPSR